MRVFLCFLIALVSAPAWAEWKKFFENEDYIHYIDSSTIYKNGNLRRVWYLQNLKNPHYEWKSQRYLLEIDCKEIRDRTLETTMHSESMATGQTTYSSKSGGGDWRFMPPGSSSEAVYKFVCAK